MHVKSLKVFCDVVARRSFSRAADENGISQSGASQLVHQLEERLGTKLIDRSKRPFVLTPEGDVYYQGCRELVQNYYALEENVRTLHHEVSGQVGIASIYSVGLSHMNESVRDFLTRFPKANVRLQYQHPDKVYDLIEHDEVDLGLVSYAKSSRSIQATAWRDEPMVVVCSPKHALAAQASVKVAELDGHDMVGFDRDLRIRREIDKALSSGGVDVRMAMEFDNIETIKRAIEINTGIGLLPAPTVVREVESRTLVTLSLSDMELIRPLGIIRRRGKQLGTTAQRFIDQLLTQEAAAESNASPGSLSSVVPLDTSSSDSTATPVE